MITMTRKIFLSPRGRRPGAAAVEPPKPKGRIPRISKLMALAIRFDQLIRDGVVADQSALAQLARVTQPRMTQIMNLSNLAPDIQEELLFANEVFAGRDPVHERMLRSVCAEVDWDKQRSHWRSLKTRNTR